MRLLGVLLVFGFVFSVCGKGRVKATESMGQEVIEIGPPVKGLPAEIEEEPSAEVDDDDKPVSTSATTQAPKGKDSKKTTTADKKHEQRRKEKEPAIDGDEDDAKIEKELSEIYKDNADYKEDKETVGKPIARAGENQFQLEPDSMEPQTVEKFRTSKDPFQCKSGRLLQGQDQETKPIENVNEEDHSITKSNTSSGHQLTINKLLSTLIVLLTGFLTH